MAYFIWQPVNSSHGKMVWRADCHVWRRCDELIVLFDLAFITFKSFAVVGDFNVAHTKPKPSPKWPMMCLVGH